MRFTNDQLHLRKARFCGLNVLIRVDVNRDSQSATEILYPRHDVVEQLQLVQLSLPATKLGPAIRLLPNRTRLELECTIVAPEPAGAFHADESFCRVPTILWAVLRHAEFWLRQCAGQYLEGQQH